MYTKLTLIKTPKTIEEWEIKQHVNKSAWRNQDAYIGRTTINRKSWEETVEYLVWGILTRITGQPVLEYVDFGTAWIGQKYLNNIIDNYSIKKRFAFKQYIFKHWVILDLCLLNGFLQRLWIFVISNKKIIVFRAWSFDLGIYSAHFWIVRRICMIS